MADEIKGDPFRGFLEALSKIDLKFRGVDNMKKHDFEIGDVIRRRGSDEEFIICDIVKGGEGLESQSRIDGSITTFFYASVEKVPSPPKTIVQVDASNWGKSRISAINAAKEYMELPTTNPITHEFICDELYETYKKKNADYGDSFAQSLDKHGLIAAIVRMDDKMNRVINLYKADEQLVEDESIRDTLMDLANYAIMSVMWLDTESANESDIYADNQKLDIDKALREGAHPQAIRDFLGGADYDGDTTNS